MGNNINYDIQEIDNSIERLKAMSTVWIEDVAKRNNNLKESSGGGRTINVMENMMKECEEVHKVFQKLIGNTISFLEKTKQEIIQADEAAAHAIKNAEQPAAE